MWEIYYEDLNDPELLNQLQLQMQQSVISKNIGISEKAKEGPIELSKSREIEELGDDRLRENEHIVNLQLNAAQSPLHAYPEATFQGV